jgi:hypothetical protein
VLHERRAWRPVDWSEDGRVLLVSEKEPDTSEPLQAVLVRAESGRLTRVPTGLAGIWGLSDDGRHVLATRGRDVVSVTAGGRVTTLVREATHPSWTK